MIGNCLVMGVDWRALGWSEYQMMLAAWNAAHSDEKPKGEPDLDRLRAFTAAHSLH